MATTEITVSYDEVALAKALRLGQADVERVAQDLALAGAKELLAQATGEAQFSTLTDVKLYRVFLLLQATGPGPRAESRIADILKIRPATAKGLVSAAMAKYGLQMRDQLSALVKGALEGARWSGATVLIAIPSGYVIERMNQLIEDLALEVAEKGKRGGEAILPADTYIALCANVGATPVTRPKG